MRRVAIAVVLSMVASLGVLAAREVVITPAPAAAALPPVGLSILSGSGADGQVDGSAGSAKFGNIIDVALDPDGDYLYVLDANSYPLSTAIRKVSTDTGAVTTLSTDPVLGWEAVDIEVDGDGDPWVMARTGYTTKGIYEFDSSGVATLMVANMCCDPGSSNWSGNAFEIDINGDQIFYTTGNATGGVSLYQASMSALPDDAMDGTDLGSPGGEWIREMALSPVGDLYVAWHGTGPYPGYSDQLFKVNGPNSFTMVRDNLPGSFQRFVFAPLSKALYATCRSGACASLERYPDGGGGEPLTIAGSDTAPEVGTNPVVDGDPGTMKSATGVAISPDGKVAYLADPGDHRIRQLRMPIDPYELSEDELCGPCNKGERHLTVPKYIDPVDVASGSLSESVADLALPSRGVPAAVTRTYNSLRFDRAGLFGLGWSTPLDMSLSEASGTIAVTQENGALLPFARLANGDIDAPPRVTSELVEISGGWELTRNATETTTFDSQGRITGWTDRNGNTTAVTRPSGSQIVTTTPGGRTLTYTLSSGRISSVSDDSSPTRTVSYGYTSGRLTSVTSFKMNASDANPVSWAYGYDGSGRLNVITDPRGMANLTHYDIEGRVDYQLDFSDDGVSGARSDITYGGAYPSEYRILTLPPHDGIGTRAQVRYDLTGLLTTSMTTGYGTGSARTLDYVFDPDTLFLESVELNGVTQSTFTYDAAGNVLTVTDAANRTTTYDDYDAFNNPGSITDNDGNESVMDYDSSGNLLESRVPIAPVGGSLEDTAVTIYERGDSSHPEDVTAIVYPDQQGAGTPKDAEFDYRSGDGQRNWSEDPEGNRTSYSYDSYGFVESVTSPRGNASGTPGDFTSTMTRNPFGLVTLTTDPLNADTSNAYDGNGNVVATTDANSQTTTVEYDDMNRVRVVHRADGSDVETTYFPNGAVYEQVNGLGDATSYAYDVHGAVLSSTDANGNATTVDYDADGLPSQRIDPGGSCPSTGCTTYGYDSANQLTSVAYSDTATPDITGITYDALGQRTAVTRSAGGNEAWAWDNSGRLRSSTDPNARTTDYSWTINGQLETVSYPGQSTPVSYTYDAAGRMASVTDWASRTTEFDFDEDSNWETTTFPSASGNVDTRTYDEAGRLDSITWEQGSTVLGSLSYDRDDEGLVTQETPTGGTFSIRTWGYDDVDQLDDVDSNPLDLDDAGNLTLTEDGTLQVFDDAQQLCWTSPTATSGSCGTPSGDATTYDYDARGNRTGATPPAGGVASEYSYDQENRLTSATVPSTRGTYQAITPSRVLDTATTTGSCPGGTCTRLAANQTITVQVTGQGNVPVDAVAAVNVSLGAVSPGAHGVLEVNRTSGGAAASTLSYRNSQANSGFAIVPVDADGRITIRSTAAVDVTVDVSGYYTDSTDTAAAGYHSTTPTVLVNTSAGIGLCNGVACSNPTVASTIDVTAAGRAGVPSSDVDAVVLSVQAASGTGTFKVLDDTGATVTTLQYGTSLGGRDVVIAPVASDGTITVSVTSATNINMIVTGWYRAASAGTEGDVWRSTAPTVAADTVAGTGACTPSPCARLGSNTRVNIDVTTAASLPADAEQVVVSVVGMNPAAGGYIRVGPNGATGVGTGGAATVTYSDPWNTSQVDTLAIVPLKTDGSIDVAATHAIDITVIVVGYFRTPVDTWAYTYDSGGIRTSKANEIESTEFTWTRGTSIPLLLAQDREGEQTAVVYGPGGTPLYQVDAQASILYFHQDQIDSTRLVTDASGSPVGHFEWSAFGRLTESSGTSEAILGYNGQYRDAETGFVYLRARYLDSSSGQFITRDPFGSSTRDAYQYAGNNPISRTDPLGLNDCPKGQVYVDRTCKMKGATTPATIQPGTVGHHDGLGADPNPERRLCEDDEFCALINRWFGLPTRTSMSTYGGRASFELHYAGFSLIFDAAKTGSVGVKSLVPNAASVIATLLGFLLDEMIQGGYVDEDYPAPGACGTERYRSYEGAPEYPARVG